MNPIRFQARRRSKRPNLNSCCVTKFRFIGACLTSAFVVLSLISSVKWLALELEEHVSETIHFSVDWGVKP